MTGGDGQGKTRREWFGVARTDLTVTERGEFRRRQRGANWFYSYLSSFSRRPARPRVDHISCYANVGMRTSCQRSGQQQFTKKCSVDYPPTPPPPPPPLSTRPKAR